jgi:hypothetical protein
VLVDLGVYGFIPTVTRRKLSGVFVTFRATSNASKALNLFIQDIYNELR